MEGGVDCSRTVSSPSLGAGKKVGKILAVRVQMLDDTITMFQIQVKLGGRKKERKKLIMGSHEPEGSHRSWVKKLPFSFNPPDLFSGFKRKVQAHDRVRCTIHPSNYIHFLSFSAGRRVLCEASARDSFFLWLSNLFVCA